MKKHITKQLNRLPITDHRSLFTVPRLLFTILMALLSNACDNPLDKTPYDKYTADFVFVEPIKAEQYVMRQYNILPYGTSETYGFNRLQSGATMIACASDEAMPNVPGSTIENITNGSWSPSSTNPDSQWDLSYQYIRSTNFGLENLYLLSESAGALKNQFYGELIFLRAYAHFELVKRYGGIPILTKSLTLEDDMNIPRNTWKECVDFVVARFDTTNKNVHTLDVS